MKTSILLLSVVFTLVQGKVYERCEFARELVNVHGLARATLGNWVCLANYESSYNTGATNDNTNVPGTMASFR